MKLRQIRFKFMTKMKIITFSMILVSVLLLINTYNYMKNEIDFTSDYIYANNTIKAINGNFYPFADSIKRPYYVHDYVATLKNDTIISYRRKLDFMGEIVYSLGCHDNYSLYRTGENEDHIKKEKLSENEIENYDYKTLNKSINIFGWAFSLIYFIIFIVMICVSIFDSDASEYMISFKIIFNIVSLIFNFIILFYITNYGFLFILLVLVSTITSLIIYANDDSDVNISKKLDKVGFAKNKIIEKTNILNTAYQSILDDDKPSKTVEKKKEIIYI